MFVAVLQARAPEHEAVVEEGAVGFADAVHPFDHVGELRDVEGGDGGDFAHHFGAIVVVRLGVVLVFEAELGVGDAVGRGADVGADAGGVGLEGEDVEITHDLHVFAALVADGDFDFDGRGIRGAVAAGGEAGFFEGGFFLAELDGGDAALDGADAVEVFIELLLVVLREFFSQIFGAGDDEIEHGAIERLGLGGGGAGGAAAAAGGAALIEEAVEDVAGIDLGGDGLGGGAEAAVGVVAFVEPLLIFFVRLRHGGELERREGGERADVVRGDLIGGDGDVDAVALA